MNRLARRELLGLHRETGHTEYVFFNDKTKKPRTDLKNGFGTACVIAGLDAFAFTICDTIPSSGLCRVDFDRLRGPPENYGWGSD
jgi:hypothetical protein